MIQNFIDASSKLDWPNLVAGAVLGAALGIVGWFLTRVYETWITSEDLPYPLNGTWFSAEFDPKGQADPKDRNTFTRVKVRRGLGGRFSVRVVEQFGVTRSRPNTAWRFSGKLIQGDTLVGTWKTTLKDTKRFGAAVLKFVDYGRAVGYWVGLAGRDYPVYGYWVMSRHKEDTQALAINILAESGFVFADVAGHVLKQPPPSVESF